MIDFTTQQLSWIVVGALGIGGTGYLTIDSKIEDMSTKVAVQSNSLENTNKQLEQLRSQLDRIEAKLDNAVVRKQQ